MILLHEHMVDIVSCLFSVGDILCAVWHKLNNLLAGREHLHQRRENGLYSISYIHRDNSRTTFLFIAERFASVILGRGVPILRDVVVDIVNRIIDFGANDALKLVVGHLVRVIDLDTHLFK